MKVVGDSRLSTFFPPGGTFRAIVRSEEQIFHLNGPAAAVWSLLEEAVSVEDLVDLLRDNLGLSIERSDVEDAIRVLSDSDLILDDLARDESRGTPGTAIADSASGDPSTRQPSGLEARPLPRDPDP